MAVTDANAASLNPYDFTITFADNVAIAVASLPGVVVEVVPPGQTAPISATVVSTTPSGATDANGNAQSFVVKYQITPPGGSWTNADNGNYTITLGGAPVTDLAGNAVASGSLGTFSVTLGAPSATVVVGSTLPGSTYGQSVSFTVVVSGEWTDAARDGPVRGRRRQLRLAGVALGRRCDQREHHASRRGQPHDRGPVLGRPQLRGRTPATIPRSSTRRL